jgi:hypothetical protein
LAVSLAEALTDGKVERQWRRTLADALVELAARMESGEATRVAGPLVQALKDDKTDPELRASLAKAVVALGARMESGEATRVAGPLVQALKDKKTGRSLQKFLVEALPSLAAWMESGEAQRQCAEAVDFLVRSRGKDADDVIWSLYGFGDSIQVVLTGFPPTRTPATATTAVTLLAGTSCLPMTGLAALALVKNPPPCRLSTEQLVDLLKDPLCVGEARRIILNQLEIRYQREFPEHWAFVRYAQNELHIDPKGPPRPR